MVAAIGSTSKTGPLSEKNKISVFFRSRLDSIDFIIFPISLSNAMIFAAYFLSSIFLICINSLITSFSA